MTDLLPHLENHDVSFAVVARAPIKEIEVVRERMGWKFLWVSSFHSDFNYDFDVSFRPDDVAAGRAQYNFQQAPDWTRDIQDLSGRSVFYKNDAGDLFHTYSAYGRGGEEVLGIYGILDSMPKGRNETGPNHSLTDGRGHATCTEKVARSKPMAGITHSGAPRAERALALKATLIARHRNMARWADNVVEQSRALRSAAG